MAYRGALVLNRLLDTATESAAYSRIISLFGERLHAGIWSTYPGHTVTTDHLAWVTTAPTATTRSVIKLSAGSCTLPVGDLYAMGPRCSICAEIEVPFARRLLTVTRRSFFPARKRSSRKALICDGMLTARLQFICRLKDVLLSGGEKNENDKRIQNKFYLIDFKIHKLLSKFQDFLQARFFL